MRDPATETESDYDAIRGDAALTMENFIRWERIKLRDAARDAKALLESGTAPTREYLDYMFTTDVGFREIRGRMTKHGDRLRELLAIRDAASEEIV